MKLGKAINKLRSDARLSQEQFAAIFDVSQQAVGKWENNESTPELGKLVKISKYFGVSMDALINGTDEKKKNEIKSRNLKPAYKIADLWEYYPADLDLEYRQSVEEGLDIAGYQEVFSAVSKLPKSEHKTALGDALFGIVENAKVRKDFPFVEPNELEDIRLLRKPFAYKKQKTVDLEDKLQGAWLGRICGCMLGKSLECVRLKELVPFLKESGNYPMHRYVYKTDITKEISEKYAFDTLFDRPFIDECDGFPADDDLNYTVLYQELIEESGREFTSEDVARKWLASQVKNAYCTAERVAYRNFIKGFGPPESAIYKNPHRELIGAQIRADYFGYINPDAPEIAAEMAWRDGRVSHIKNGIYGEMFVAAMLACAAVNDDFADIIRAGLAQIPSTSRLYAGVASVLDDFSNGVGKEAWFENFHRNHDDTDEYTWTLTTNNAMLVAACLLYGEGDFARSICMAVENGFDTDCNGATVGSVIGMAKGKDIIPPYWSKPINNTLHTSLFGLETLKISDRVALTLQHIQG